MDAMEQQIDTILTRNSLVDVDTTLSCTWWEQNEWWPMDTMYMVNYSMCSNDVQP